MPKIRFGVFMGADPESLALADRIGLDLICMGDGPAMMGDLYVRLARAAMLTKKPRISPAVTVPFFRHPYVAASSIMDIQQLSNGRAIFALGSGYNSIEYMQERPASLKELQEYGLAVKALAANKKGVYRGKEMEMAWKNPPPPVPLWFAGDGPKGIELAGRVGDGVIIGNAATVSLVEWGQRHVIAGARETGRDPSHVEIWNYPRVILCKSTKEGIAQNAFVLADYAAIHFRNGYYDKGVAMDEDIADRLDKFRAEFNMGLSHDPGINYNVELVKKYGLYDWLANQLLVAGPPEVIIERLQQLIAAGGRNFVFRVMPDLSTAEELSKKVLDKFR